MKKTYIDQTFLGIMDAQLRAALNPLYHDAVIFEGFQGGLNSGTHDAERCQSLGQLNV